MNNIKYTFKINLLPFTGSFGGSDMLTLEVNGHFITWPEDYAVMMMGYYKLYGVPFMVHRKCIHIGSNAVS
jgi:hypothetical protein